eukprot:TRINITY_DN22651_c0_g1_i12.p1 TRINITY_DN22651_c0_g1~~TRINITY_DN22651_c0_g1_i12.p1  ORF type:complete len:491 (-),score=24.62 TRINITY_DN22651_c0_g1_i12:994-2331(-)
MQLYSNLFVMVVLSVMCHFCDQAYGQGCKTELGCTCKSSWNYKGTGAQHCSNPDGDVFGTWCVVAEQDDGNGVCNPQWKVQSTGEFWDRCYCTPQRNQRGCITQSGCVCKSTWKYKGKEVNECSNPDGDALGDWCVIDESKSTDCTPISTVNDTGESWDRCSCGSAIKQKLEEAAEIGDAASRSITLQEEPTAPIIWEGCRAPNALWCDVEFLRVLKMNMPLVAQYELSSWVDGTKSLAPTNPCGSQPWLGIQCVEAAPGQQRVGRITLGMYDWAYSWTENRWTFSWSTSRTINAAQLPRELSKVAYLQELELAYTFIDAVLPPELSELTNLKVLDISGNSVQNDAGVRGTLPPEFSVLTLLKVFSAFQNKLTGTIPVEYSTLSNLDQLKLSSNNLSGSIPPQFSTFRGELWFGTDNSLCISDLYSMQFILTSSRQTDAESLAFC